jgi:hypothetical protein
VPGIGGVENLAVVFRPLGRLKMLQWSPRLVALAAVVALLLVALLGAGFEDWLNLYW